MRCLKGGWQAHLGRTSKLGNDATAKHLSSESTHGFKPRLIHAIRHVMAAYILEIIRRHLYSSKHMKGETTAGPRCRVYLRKTVLGNALASLLLQLLIVMQVMPRSCSSTIRIHSRTCSQFLLFGTRCRGGFDSLGV